MSAELTQQLFEFGFSEVQVQNALSRTSSLENAVSWICGNEAASKRAILTPLAAATVPPIAIVPKPRVVSTKPVFSKIEPKVGYSYHGSIV